MKIFTIGYEDNSAEEFFSPLLENKIKKVFDIRLKPHGGGFASKRDLPYLLSAIGKSEYDYIPEYAPSKELFSGMKTGSLGWSKFKSEYNKMLKERNVISIFSKKRCANACFLCYETDPNRCHRKILAEYHAKELNIPEICHL
ncbi:MAG: DUF488 domain-containing protein [Methanoregulaceae archaeon]|jgi:uncharacterized protein YeaO (DUF488 family)